MGISTGATSDLSLEWLYDRRIGVFTLHSSHRDVIDRWCEQIIDLRRTYPMDKPLLLAHDTSQVSITPYARHRLQQLSSHAIQHKGRFAVIIKDGVVERGISLLINRMFMQIYRGVEQGQCFTTKERAIAWLAEWLTP